MLMRPATVLLLLVMTGCTITIQSTPPITGSGVLRTTPIDVPEFTKVKLGVPADVEIQCGQEQSVRITTDDNLQPLIRSRVTNGVLSIETDENLQPSADTVIQITVPNLESIAISGSGDVTVRGMSGESADISVSGSGSITGDVTTQKLDISIAGAGDVKLQGAAPQTSIHVSGSGDVSLLDLSAEDVSVSIAGSGDVEIQAAKSLDVSIAGSGSIRYQGDPRVEKSILGSGDVTRLKP